MTFSWGLQFTTYIVLVARIFDSGPSRYFDRINLNYFVGVQATNRGLDSRVL